MSVLKPCASWVPGCATNKRDDDDDEKDEKGKDNKDEDKPKSRNEHSDILVRRKPKFRI
jgi:hypothetical protein